MTRKTLEEMNANPFRRQWSEYTLETTYAVGGMGRSWSASRSGAKFHLISVETVVDRDEEALAAAYEANPKRGRGMKIGHVFSTVARCNGNGQHTGIVARGYDTDRINCKNCGG